MYEGSPIHIKQLLDVFWAHEEETVDVLCGLHLSVEYGHIFDDVSNTTPGYSFIHDPRNPFHKHRTALLDAILTSPDLYAKFIISKDGGQVQWNRHALHQWLLSYSKLQHLQLVRVNMTTGFPSWGTELTIMLLKNTQTYALRNCFVFGSYVTLLFTYLSLSGNASALDAFSSDILIQDLSIACPFAALAAHICYNKSPDIAGLYRTHVFINQDRLFNTDDLTLGLELLTLPHLSIKLGVQRWRHITTAFRGKISTHMRPILHYEEHSTPDLPNGHSRRMENHIYAQARPRGVAHHLFPSILKATQHARKDNI